ncbi:MAG: hypothetical protein IPK55_15425 [Streptococcus sp.]|nr:hypothetical protein [Streptococcus sp.]
MKPSRRSSRDLLEQVKTETTKDLQKQWLYIVSFSIALRGFDAKAMTKFFKKLVSNGSWSCLE